jgi:hypothetical protein
VEFSHQQLEFVGVTAMLVRLVLFLFYPNAFSHQPALTSAQHSTILTSLVLVAVMSGS